MLLSVNLTFSQVSVLANFDSGIPAGWTNSGYSASTSQACAGQSVRHNVYSGSASGTMGTPNLVGSSNGTDLSVTFDYKVVNWSAATVATPAGWGTADLQYSTDDGTNWISALLIDDTNHAVANTCATKMVTILGANLPTGSDVKLRIITAWSAGDYYFYIDNFSATQVAVSPPSCDAVLSSPADGATDAPLDGDISWSPATGVPTGYNVTIGTSTGASDVYSGALGNVTTVNVGTLAQGTQYFVNIIPFNDNGNATGCTEYSFTTFTPPENDICSGAIPITPSAEGTGCAASTFNLPFSTDGTSDSGVPQVCSDPGLDQYFTWTATSLGLTFNDGAGAPGIAIFASCADATAGNEIACANTFSATDTRLTGWALGDDLFIQIYDFQGSVADVAFCLEEYNPPVAPECATNPMPVDGATNVPVGPITLSWDAPATGVSPTSYNLYVGSMADGSDLTLFDNYTTTTTGNDIVVNLYDTTIYYQVRSVNEPTEALGCSVWSFTTEPAPPAPANDECLGAISLVVNTDLDCTSITSATTVSATASSQSDDAVGTPNNDVWFTFVATASNHRIVLSNITNEPGDATTSTDMAMSVFNDLTGCNMVAANEVGESDPNTLNLTGLTATDTYYVRVYSYGTSVQNNNFDICVGTPLPPPMNDSCATPTVISTSTDFMCNNSMSGTTQSATTASPDGCSTSGKDVWYSFTPTTSEMFDIAVTETLDIGFNSTYLSLYTGSCGGLTQVGTSCFNTTGITEELTQGITYLINVRSSSTTATNYVEFDLCIGTIPPPPVNDDLCGAIALGLNATSTGNEYTNVSSTFQTDEPIPTCWSSTANGKSVWFTFTAPVGGEATITTDITDNSFTDHHIALYEAPTDCTDITTLGTDIACDEDGGDLGSGYRSVINATGLTAGDTYYVQFSGYSGTEGLFGIEIQTPACGNTTTWNDATSMWSNGTPNDGTLAAVIDGVYVTGNDGPIDACSITVSATGNLTVSATTFISAQNEITNSGVMTVEHTANVVQVDDTYAMSSTGVTKVSVDTPTVTSTGFVVLGSPVEADTREGVWASAFNVQAFDTSLFVANAAVQAAGVAYNFAGTDFTEWSPTTGALNPAEGYLVRPQASYGGAGGSFTYDYDGTLNNGVVTSTLTYNGAQLDSPNILSNPYASAMDADLFLAANTEVDALYFWNHLTEPSAMIPGSGAINFSMEDISVYNDMGGVAAGNGGTAPTNVVSTAQGFGVFASSAGTATFNNSMRLTSGNTTLRSADAAKDRIWLNIFNEQYSVGGNTLVGFTTNATEGFDSGYDNSRLGTAISLYSHINSGDDGYSIQGREAFDSDMEVLLGFSSIIGEEALYVISITDLDGLAWDNNDIFLIDNLLNVKTQLNDTDYTFTSIGGTFNDRFTLVFVDRDVLGTTTADLNAVTLSPNPTSGLVNVVSPRSLVNSISITDIQGRIVNTVSVNGLNSYQLDMTSLRSAVYFVKVTTEAGTITKRLIKK